MKYLISACASVTRLDKFKRSITHYAAQGGCVELMKFLVLEKSCDVFATDKYGNSSLHIAATYGKVEVVRWIMAWHVEEIIQLGSKDSFTDLLRLLFKRMMQERLRQSQLQKFSKKWMLPACKKLKSDAPAEFSFILPHTSNNAVEVAMAKYDPLPEDDHFKDFPEDCDLFVMLLKRILLHLININQY